MAGSSHFTSFKKFLRLVVCKTWFYLFSKFKNSPIPFVGDAQKLVKKPALVRRFASLLHLISFVKSQEKSLFTLGYKK